VTEAAARVVQGIKLARLAPSTRETYGAGLRAWASFCASHDRSLMFGEDENPALVGDTLELFVGHLLATRRVTSSSTVTSYLSAVSALHVDAGLPSPTQEARKVGRLRELTQGLQKVLPVARRAPALTVRDLQPATSLAFARGGELNAGIAALTVLAATAMLRVHEYIVCEGGTLRSRGLEATVLGDTPQAVATARQDARAWRARQAVRTCDVYIPPGTATLVVRLRAWKFSQTGAQHTIPIQCSPDWTMCAHCCVLKFLSVRETARQNAQVRRPPPQWLAQLSDGTFITEEQITQHVQLGGRLSGLENWRDCTPHSLRRGGATLLFQASRDKTMVREVGRWRSDTGIDPYLVTHTQRYHSAWQRALSDVDSQGATLNTQAR
jgi:hypothetical protein